MTIKLTALQLVLLSTAAARVNGNLLPTPESVSSEPARIRKAIASLLKRQLVTEVDGTDAALAWREDCDRHIGVIISAAGRAAIGGDEPEQAQVSASSPRDEEKPVAQEPESSAVARPTKAAVVLALLRREVGATLDELVAAIGWLPHTTRAALTGLRKKGHVLDKSKRGEVTCYRVAEVA